MTATLPPTAYESTVRIVAIGRAANTNGTVDEFYCGGVAIRRGDEPNQIVVATAKHCVEGSGDSISFAVLSDNETCAPDGQRVARNYDIAVAEFTCNEVIPLAASTDLLPPPMSRLVVLGYPDGTMKPEEQAAVSLAPMPYGMSSRCVSCRAGDSGSGVWYNGKLSGILSLGDDTDGMMVYVPIGLAPSW